MARGWESKAVEGQVQEFESKESRTKKLQLTREQLEVRRKIEDALRRSAELDASRITVEANGAEVILRGTVKSWAERQEAERAAWAAPGVTRVENRITISV